MIGIPATFNAMWRPVEELEMLTRAALAEDTESVGTKPADTANAQMVVKADVFDVMIRPLGPVARFAPQVAVRPDNDMPAAELQLDGCTACTCSSLKG